MDRTGSETSRGPTRSVFHELDSREAIVTAAKDQVAVLRPHDARYAMGVEDIGECCCLVLIGTSPGFAVIMAQISTTNGEEHYMSLVRLMIGTLIKEEKSFQLPLALCIFGHRPKDDVQIDLFAERTSKVFQHLNVKVDIIFCTSRPAAGMHTLPYRLAVVAVRHEPEAPEIYVGNCLLYPKVHSGSLALAFDKLGLRQIDCEHGDDEENGNERGKLEKSARAQNEAHGNEEKNWGDFRKANLAVGAPKR